MWNEILVPAKKKRARKGTNQNLLETTYHPIPKENKARALIRTSQVKEPSSQSGHLGACARDVVQTQARGVSEAHALERASGIGSGWSPRVDGGDSR